MRSVSEDARVQDGDDSARALLPEFFVRATRSARVPRQLVPVSLNLVVHAGRFEQDQAERAGSARGSIRGGKVDE